MQWISGIGYYSSDSYTITEGIGFGLSYGFWTGPIILTHNTGEWKPQLACFSNNGTVPTPTFHSTCFDAVGIPETDHIQNNFSVYPNPAVDIVHVQIRSDAKNNFLDLVDLTGRVLQRHMINSRSLDLNVQKLTKGVYILKLYCGNLKTAHRKLIIY